MLRTIMCIVFCLTLFGCKTPKNLSSPDDPTDVSTDTINDVDASHERTPVDVPDSKVFDSLEAEMISTGSPKPFDKMCFNSDVPIGGKDFELLNCNKGCCTFAILDKNYNKDTGCREQWCALEKPCTWVAYKKPWCGESALF